MPQPDVSPFVSRASLWLPEEYPFSAWLRNAPFAFWVIDAARPRTLVELGTHNGFSYLCFCQAAATLESQTQCFAVDTWEGDEHAGFYGEEVLTELRGRHDSRYSGFSRLVQSTFDEAVAHFEDGSVDLLHIDGRHYYEDVRHDFETWLPKMSERGVVLFHDINVRERGFGVHRLWSEVAERYPSFAFTDEHGLGVITTGTEPPEAIARLTAASDDMELSSAIRSLYQRLGDGVVLTSQTSELRTQVETLASVADERAMRLGALESEVRGLILDVGEARGARALEAAARAEASTTNDELREKIRELSRTAAHLRSEVHRLATRNQELDLQNRDMYAYVGTLEANLNEIYASRSWKSLASLRATAQRHPRILGAPMRALRGRSSAGSDEKATVPTVFDLLDREHVAAALGADFDVDRYLALPPAATVAPLAIATGGRLDASEARTIAELIGIAAVDPGILNPLLAHDWPASPSTFTPADLVALSERVPNALQRLTVSTERASNATGPVDVIIPVFNAPVHVDRCIRTLYANTDPDLLGSVVIADDGSGPSTARVIDDLAERFGFRVLRRDVNVGYTRNVNDALTHTTADLVLLLNSDCYVGTGTVGKLASLFQADPTVGLASPLASSAPPVTLPTFPGFSYNDVERMLDRLGAGAPYRACTIVGNCLMMSRACIDVVGGFGEEWGVGYGEETDYHFRALEKGFSAAIATDAYVFHEGAASFGKEAEAERQRSDAFNRFMEKWGAEYRRELAKYEDPTLDVVAVSLHEADEVVAELDVLIILPALSQVIGGTMVASDIACDLIARGWKVSVALPRGANVTIEEGLPYNPLTYDDIGDLVERVSAAAVFATAWTTAADAAAYADETGATPFYLIQGYEPIFASGESYQTAVESYELIENRICVSRWLTERLEAVGFDSDTNVFGPDERHFNALGRDADESEIVTVGMMLRGSVEKGDPVLLETAFRLRDEPTVRLLVLDPSDSFTLDIHPSEERVAKPVSREELARILRGVDIWVDASLHEGYGRIPAEAMACGAAVVMADTGGGREYAGSDGVFVVTSPTDVDDFLDALTALIHDQDALSRAKAANADYALRHSWEIGIDNFSGYLTQRGISPANRSLPSPSA